MMIRIAVKIPAIPFAMISSAIMILDVFIDKTLLIIKNFYKNFEKSVRNPFLVKYRSEGRPLRRKNHL